MAPLQRSTHRLIALIILEGVEIFRNGFGVEGDLWLDIGIDWDWMTGVNASGLGRSSDQTVGLMSLDFEAEGGRQVGLDWFCA